MSYYKKTKAYASKKMLIVAGTVLCVIFALFSTFLYFGNVPIDKKADKLITDCITSKEDKVMVTRTKLTMEQGELFDPGNAEMVAVPFELVPGKAITSISMLKGMRLKHIVCEGEILTKEDIMPDTVQIEEGARLIEHNFAEGTVPASVVAGSFIDIKLFLGNEEDKVVASKIMVVSRSANLLSFHMNAKEQEYIKESATEGLLIAVKYIDAGQLPSEVTYVPAYEKEMDK